MELDFHPTTWKLDTMLPATLIRALGVTFSTNTMNIIFSLLLALMPSAFPFKQPPAQASQAKESLPVSITDLRKAPTKVVLDGRSLSLSAYLWRDFMLSNFPAPDGSPMMAVLKVTTADKEPFPSGVRMDRAWVLFEEQVWEANEFRAQVKSPRYDRDSWINCSNSPVCEVTARGGPKWGPDVFVDVVVRLIDREGRRYLLQARKQYVQRTD
jgi:hypothetical protein